MIKNFNFFQFLKQHGNIIHKKKIILLPLVLFFLFCFPLVSFADFPDNMPYDNDLTIITGITEHYSSSSVLTSFELHYYHIPFIFWIIIAVVSLWVATRLILEFIIRWRN